MPIIVANKIEREAEMLSTITSWLINEVSYRFWQRPYN
jgi:hypothetical protein